MKMACAALGMYLVRLRRRACCSRAASAFTTFTFSCEQMHWHVGRVQVATRPRCSRTLLSQQWARGERSLNWKQREQQHLQAAVLDGVLHGSHHLVDVIGCRPCPVRQEVIISSCRASHHVA